ncbi:response regulator [Paenibacillus hamazuiensis]|uniref:response regulator n=1 Tax=Paenibacillus hamazuiensis TaxID=2936508 RepID=UPI00200BEE5B|nr:response regulator [Paenibacillus hamazuiensis]
MANKIMIADDSAFMRIILRDIIVQMGHHVVEAENGSAAVEKYKEQRPDLTVMNIVMPEMYGIEALRHIREIDPNAKVIMCSSMGNQHNVVSAIQAGALDFVVKPFDPGRLVDAIKRAIAK